MKNLMMRGVYGPRQNQLFKAGQRDGLFHEPCKMDDEDYLTGYEVGRKLRLQLKEEGARVSVQALLFSDQFKGKI